MAESAIVKKYGRDLAIAGITAVSVIVGNYVTAGPANRSADNGFTAQLIQRIESLENRAQRLEAEKAQLNAQLTDANIKRASLEATMTDELNFKDLLCEVLEAQPGLNWAKIVEKHQDGEIVFRMLCLDAEYRARFQIGLFQYEGRTDYDIWPKETADSFFENDLTVYNQRRFVTTKESWLEPLTQEQVTGTLTKWYFEFAGVEFVLGHLPKDI